MQFLNSLKKRSIHYSSPFSHWELNEPLTQDAINEICKTEITDLTKMNINYLVESSEKSHFVLNNQMMEYASGILKNLLNLEISLRKCWR